jgi:putative PIN family toxin of toxin-antitoxin system
MSLRLVLDTNVWLDWLVFDDSGLAMLKSAVSTGQAEIIIDAACEAELFRVLEYPLQKWTLDSAGRARCLAQYRRLARPVEIHGFPELPRCADADDQKFLELAAGAAANWLLTKDHALLALNRHRASLPFQIVTPADFAICQG